MLTRKAITVGNLRKLWRIGLIALAASAICSGIAAAGPQNGFGAYVGLIGAAEGQSNTKGLSLGMDAQFTSKDNWSLNPYLMVSGERDSASRSLADGLAGLQIRRWFDDWFVGVHGFVHDRLVFAGGSVQSSSYGPGMGVVAGLELADGWGAELQTNLFESTATSDTRNALQLSLTYRWH